MRSLFHSMLKIAGVLFMAVSMTAAPHSSFAASPTLYDVAGQGVPDLDAVARAITGQRWFAQSASNYCVGYAALNSLRRNGHTFNPDELEREYEQRWPAETWMQVPHVIAVLQTRGVRLVSVNFALKDGRWRHMAYADWERQTGAYVAGHLPVDVYPWLTGEKMYHAVTVIALRSGIVHYIDPRDGREYEAPAAVFWRAALGPRDTDGGYVNKWIMVRRVVR
jgi:hypothetical protein